MQTFVVFRKDQEPVEIAADTYGLVGDDWVLYAASEWTDAGRREIQRFRRADVNGIALKDWN